MPVILDMLYVSMIDLSLCFCIQRFFNSFMNSTEDFLPEATLLFKRPFVEILFDEINKIVITRWKGTLTIEQVHEVVLFKEAFIRKNEIKHNLNDHLELNVLSPELQQYLEDDGHPILRRAGLRKIAVRLAKDIFAQATVRKVNKKEEIGEGLAIAVFPSYKDAYAWLLAK